MKQKILLIICITILSATLIYLQWGRTPFLNHSITSTCSNGYQLTLSVTVNKLAILNKKCVALSIVQHIQNNDFENVSFSYDTLGYPNEVSVTVYANHLSYNWGFSSFTLHCTQGNPGEFTYTLH